VIGTSIKASAKIPMNFFNIQIPPYRFLAVRD